VRRTLAVLVVCAVGGLASATAAQAGNTTVTNITFPVDIFQFVPCAAGGAGEVVELTGDIHDVARTTINGNHFSMAFHENVQGLSGTGLTTGDKYQVTGTATLTFNGNFNNGQAEDTFTGSFDVIGQGPGNNLVSKSNTSPSTQMET
jgi:hypothetical protein